MVDFSGGVGEKRLTICRPLKSASPGSSDETRGERSRPFVLLALGQSRCDNKLPSNRLPIGLSVGALGAARLVFLGRSRIRKGPLLVNINHDHHQDVSSVTLAAPLEEEEAKKFAFEALQALQREAISTRADNLGSARMIDNLARPFTVYSLQFAAYSNESGRAQPLAGLEEASKCAQRKAQSSA